MEFLLELAVLRGRQTLQNSESWPPDDELQFLRYLAGSRSEILPTKCIDHADASRSFYRSNCSKEWLRTVLAQAADTALRSEYELSVQSNVVPSGAYLTWLEDVRAKCGEDECTGGFVPISNRASNIGFATEGRVLHQSCTECALAEQLRVRLEDHRAVDELASLLKFWYLGEKDVELVRDINGGADGEVSIILWKHGTFARKRFRGYRSTTAKLENLKFHRELEVALRVSHPNIVHCFGYSAAWDLFMEVLDEDLEGFLSRSEEMDPPFSLRDSLEILLQVAEAMKHLHENSFIHGDLKPGNILLSKLRNPHPGVPFYLVKVADFGCAQHFPSSFCPAARDLKDFDVRIGSWDYLAPEIKQCRKLPKTPPHEELLRAVQNIDPPKVDVFSFGVLANEVVEKVHETDRRRSSLKGRLQEFLKRCEAQEPEARPFFAEICETLSCLSSSMAERRRSECSRCCLFEVLMYCNMSSGRDC